MTTVKRINSDVRVMFVNNRAVALIRKVAQGYLIDELYAKREHVASSYNLAKEIAANSQQF